MKSFKHTVSEHLLTFQICLMVAFNTILRIISYPWQPNYLVFDEKYYIPQAIGMAYQEEGRSIGETAYNVFKDTGGFMEAYDNNISDAIATNDVFQHPPFGKWLISLGTYFYNDPLNYSGWRFSSVIASILIVIVIMILAKALIPENRFVPLIAGLLVSVDGQLLVMGHMGMLDIFISLFVIVGTLFLILSIKYINRSLLFSSISGISLGLATAVKWNSVLWVFAGLIILIIVAIFTKKIKYYFSSLLLLFSSVFMYLVTWILSPVGSGNFWNRLVDIFDYHKYVANFLFTSDDGSAVGSSVPFPFSWIIQSSDWGYTDCSSGTCKYLINSGNPVLWCGIWLSVISIIVLVIIKRIDVLYSVPALMFLMGVIPWFSGTRHPWLSYTVQILPLGVICLIAILALIYSKGWGKIFTNFYISIILIISIIMYPNWSMIG